MKNKTRLSLIIAIIVFVSLSSSLTNAQSSYTPSFELTVQGLNLAAAYSTAIERIFDKLPDLREKYDAMSKDEQVMLGIQLGKKFFEDAFILRLQTGE